MLMQVPIIDVAPFRNGDAAARASVAAQVGQAVNDIGFLVITGHGIDPALIARVQAISNQFFDLPITDKQHVARPAPDVTRGYIALEGESVGRSRGLELPGDLNESFMIGPVDTTDDPYFTAKQAGRHFHPNLWPQRPSALQPLYETYFRAMGALAADLMTMFARALNLPEDFFATSIDRHISRLRVRNYPAPLVPPLPNQLRAGAHADYGSLTILRTEDKPGGLQVLNKAGDWVDVPIAPDSFIVNIGELMARWTNGRWKATLHRVVNPPTELAAVSRRLSLVFFHNPNYDALVTALPGTVPAGETALFPPTTSGDHLRGQFVRTQIAES